MDINDLEFPKPEDKTIDIPSQKNRPDCFIELSIEDSEVKLGIFKFEEALNIELNLEQVKQLKDYMDIAYWYLANPNSNG